jgi:hypothetical protein
MVFLFSLLAFYSTETTPVAAEPDEPDSGLEKTERLSTKDRRSAF